MSTTSQMFAAKAALVDLLEAAPSIPVDVHFGYPGSPKKEGVYVGKVKGEYEPHAIGTQMPRLERMTIEVTVTSAGRGSQRSVSQRCCDLGTAFEALVLDNRTLSATVRDDTMIVASELMEGATGDKGRYAYLDYTISARAHLR